MPKLTRRNFIRTAALAGTGLRAASALGLDSPVSVVRNVREGQLRGQLENGLQVFRGVPFAQPPVGPLRFRAPLAPIAYTAPRDAMRYAPEAMQPGQPDVAQSEDCLYLNIWAPAAGGPYPVLVWIHGGGFTGGRSSETQFAGSHFANAGVVTITVAYRLGVFGFLDLAPLLGNAYQGSANNGLRDLIRALEWVQQNVAAFGGDPARVTIGGESAGAKLTDLLLATPAAQGLFQQAISESGGAERIAPISTAAEVSRGFGSSWTQRTQLAASEIAKAPASELIEVQQAFTATWPAHFPLRPELDAALYPRAPLPALRAGACGGKRLLLGTNRDESAFFLGPHPERAVAAGDLGNLPLPSFDAIAARYRTIDPDLPADQIRVRSVTAEEYWIPSLRVADAFIAGGGQAFVYRLDYPGTGRFAGLAYHSYDLRFVWNSFGKQTATSAAEQLATSMHAAWIAFLKGDAPAGPGLPAWPAYGAARPTMIFDQVSQIELDPSGAERRLWDGVLTG